MDRLRCGSLAAPDTIDSLYLASLSHTVDALGVRGIYSVLDMHQDVNTPLRPRPLQRNE